MMRPEAVGKMRLSVPTIGRMMVMLAILFQAIGKVAYGTWLTWLPSPFFVFISFNLAAVLFLVLAGRGAGEPAWGPLILLNVSTALTFLCFFFALKLIEPAIVGAVEIGIGPVFAVIGALVVAHKAPGRKRIVVCMGILLGSVVLALAALRESGLVVSGGSAWLGLLASAVSGMGAVLITVASKTLVNRGWTSGAVLAHRFYLIVPLSLFLTLGADTSRIEWSGWTMLTVLAISVFGVIGPLYLLQLGIKRCETYTVMVTMSALPAITFAMEGLSPAYTWSWRTLVGIAIIIGFILLDIKRDFNLPSIKDIFRT